jgi:serine/threonine-protein kinase
MKKLRIKVGTRGHSTFPIEGDPRPITVKEGWGSVMLWAPWKDLPANTLLAGKLSFGGERIYGRFTEARIPRVGSVRVCMELVEIPGGEPGEPMWPGSTADSVKVSSAVRVEAVDRFRSEE